MGRHSIRYDLSRRSMLAVGATALPGLSLAAYSRMSAAGELAEGTADSAILVDLRGGPSHIDTFDPKPDAAEYRGEFAAIETKTPGLRICEHLPRLAGLSDKFAVLRGVTHSFADHGLGRKYVYTGNPPTAAIEYPIFGSVAAKELTGIPEIPNYVAIPKPMGEPGYLGVEYSPLATGIIPRGRRPFSVRGLSQQNKDQLQTFQRRHDLLGQLDTTFAGHEAENELLNGLDRFSQRAFAIISSPRTRDALDFSRVPPQIVESFGDSTFGRSCLLATRLIEAGVRFVTITFNGWDTHGDNFRILKNTQLPSLDAGLAGMLQHMHETGLSKTTAVCMTGDFGRTPKINPKAGREHHPRAMFMLLSGGGVTGGRVHGASDENGMGPLNEGYSPGDVAATVYHTLGIDPRKEFKTRTGRPVMIVRHGRVIPEVFS